MMRSCLLTLLVMSMWHAVHGADYPLRVGSAAVALHAENAMVIGGGIFPYTVQDQEGELRATATVIQKPGSGTVALVACDVLMLNRDIIDPAIEAITQATGIPASHVLVSCTHTHHAPSTVTIHGYERDELFCRRVREGIVSAVKQAHARLAPARFDFRLGEESSVGQNSRMLLADGQIYWVGPREDVVRPTGPFDPELPVLAFPGPNGALQGLVYNHSTHTIGVRTRGRSPSFYGLAAQDLERELHTPIVFLEGASGSTHNLTLTGAESTLRIKQAVRLALSQAAPRVVERIVAIKKPFTFRVRTFDEAREDAMVTAYCQSRVARDPHKVIEVFRAQRKVLAPRQGEERTTVLQALAIGDVAIVGVPAEFFTVLGQEIKRQSPYRYTYISELANDWIGYLPDRTAHALGGYQTWTGLHSFAEPGTGERVVRQAVEMLQELHASR